MAYTLGGSGSLHPEVETEDIEQESAMPPSLKLRHHKVPRNATVADHRLVDSSAIFRSVISQNHLVRSFVCGLFFSLHFLKEIYSTPE